MPGVPKSRGCDACRKRKKRCDAVEDVSSGGCSWCRKLGILCVGFGKQRFAFKDENKRLRDKYRKDANTVGLQERGLVKPQTATITISPVTQSPTNPTVKLTQAFVVGISTDIDVSHQLAWNFGGFLYEIPKRLGANEALDASADLLITAHAKYCIGLRRPDVDVLVKQQRALSALRRCLGDPRHAHSSETLCAVMIQSICEVFIGGDNNSLKNHYIGATKILKGRGLGGPRDEFEKMLLLTLRGPVVVGALSDHGLDFTEEEWETLIMPGFEATNLDSEMMLWLCRMPNLMRRAHIALASDAEPNLALEDARSAVRSVQRGYFPVHERLRQRWEATEANFLTAGSNPSVIQRFVHCHHARILAFGIAFAMLLNNVIAKLEPATRPRMAQENDLLAEEILALACVGHQYRPLGSMAMATFLGTAWRAASHPALAQRVQDEFAFYCQDIPGYEMPHNVQDLSWCMQKFHLD